jgi:glycosyltransferase involved in cell wall biosynthesis
VIGLYCPDVPPIRGGVSDHTLVLARALAAAGSPPLVLAERGEAACFAPLTCLTGLAPGDVPETARAHGVTWLLLQYVPFLYARRGVAPGLVRAVARLAARGIRLALFVHEPYVPLTRLPWLLTGPLQRWQFRALVRRASLVYTPVPRFAELARRRARAGTTVRVVPIGATLPVSPATRAAARAELGLADDEVAIGIFSPGASGFAHEWIAVAAARLRDDPRVRWVRFGHGSDRRWPRYPNGPRTLILGERDAERTARTMRALDLVAAPYVDGLTLRRTSAMLALATGIATVSSTGPLYDPAAGALAACEATAEAFAARLEGLAGDAAARDAVASRTTAYPRVASAECAAATLLRDVAGA